MKIEIGDKEVMCDSPFVSFNKTSFTTNDGKEGEWFSVSRKNDTRAVVIVATVNNRMVVTKEFRVPLEDYEWGLPAGLIDEGETIEEAAMRELKEETGLDTVRIIRTSPFIYNSAGLTDESISMVYLEAEGEPSDDLNEGIEDIETFLMDKSQVSNLLARTDVKFGAKAWMAMTEFSNSGRKFWKNEAIVRGINDTPSLLSMLYDLNLLPEQLEEGSSNWNLMVGIVLGYKTAKKERK